MSGTVLVRPVSLDALMQGGEKKVFHIPASAHPEISFYDVAGAKRMAPPETTFPIDAGILRNVEVHYRNLILGAGGALLEPNVGYTSSELCQLGLENFPLFNVRDAAGNARIALRPPAQAPYRYPANGDVTCLTAHENYSAWILGEVPRLLLAKAAVPEVRVVLHGHAKPFHMESLQAAGLAAERVECIDRDVVIAFERLLWVTPTYFHQIPHPAGTEALSRLGGEAAAGNARVYTSRSSSAVGLRRLLNEEEIEGLVEGHGYELLRPESMTFPEQLSRMRGTRVLAGPFGAALANAVFMPAGGTIIEIATKLSLEFVRIAAQRRLHFVRVPTWQRKFRDGLNVSTSNDYVVKPEEFQAALRIADSLS